MALIILLAFSCTEGKDQGNDEDAYPLRGSWAMDELWNDGKAEVATYQAVRMVYGKPRQFEYTYILVKEKFNRQYQVKTDDYDREDLYDMMKINKFCRIPTEAYPYHYLTSVFVHANQPNALHKLTNTSQEWCGNTAKSISESKDSYLFEFFSYWDNQGNGKEKIVKPAWFEDQLSYTLRCLEFKEGLTFEVPLYPTQVSSKANIPKMENARITVTSSPSVPEVNIQGISANKIWQVDVSRGTGADLSFWFSGEYPNHLLKMQGSDGRSLLLSDIKREAYWEKE